MPDVPLIFRCPSCGVRLTVPSSAAGAVGPCPHCRQSIRAPLPPLAAAIAPPPTPVPITPALVPRLIKPQPAAAPSPPPVPPAAAIPFSPQPFPPPSAYPGYPGSFAPPAGSFHPIPPIAPVAVAFSSPAVVAPAPPPPPPAPIGRSTSSGQVRLTGRTGTEESDREPTPASSQRPRYAASPIPARAEKRPILPQILIPLVFLVAAAAVIIGLKAVIEKEREMSDPVSETDGANGSRGTAVIPEDQIPPTFVKPGISEITSTAGSSTQPTLPQVPSAADTSPAANDPTSDVGKVQPGTRGLAVLEQFLSATTLEERLPMLETRADSATLASTSLAGALPARLKIETDIHVPNRAENFVDLYYNVDFQSESGKPNLQTVVVRLRGDQPPKVLADPFLDLFDGRLAAFAATPVADGGTFHAIVSADAFCWDANVPGSDKKLTLKLFSRGNSQEITRAYLGKLSPIGTMLDSDASSELSYGQAKPATVSLRWNLTEDPKRPYLEAVAITAFHWNP